MPIKFLKYYKFIIFFIIERGSEGEKKNFYKRGDSDHFLTIRNPPISIQEKRKYSIPKLTSNIITTRVDKPVAVLQFDNVHEEIAKMIIVNLDCASYQYIIDDTIFVIVYDAKEELIKTVIGKILNTNVSDDNISDMIKELNLANEYNWQFKLFLQDK